MVSGRRLCPLLTVALLIVVMLAACGGDDDVDLSAGVDPASSTTTTTLDPDAAVSSPAQTLPADKSGGTALLVKPARDAADVRPTTFDVTAVKAVDGGVLVPFWGGIAPCFVLDRYTVDETPQQVRIALFAGREPGRDDVACAELARQYEVKVPLDAPLGTRTVVDANA
jgi:hypothetical protein